MNQSFIFLQTLQHTGTWFLIQFLLSHPDVSGFSEFYPLDPWNLEKKLEPYGDKNLKQPGLKLEAGKKNIIHLHFTSQEATSLYYSVNNAVALIQPGVVPIRDPLLALLSHKSRAVKSGNKEALRNINNPELILIAWDRVIHLYKEFEDAGLENFLFFPIDLIYYYEPHLRYNWLDSVLSKYNLLPARDIVNKWVDEWPVFNKTDHEFRNSYLEDNAKKLRKEYPVIIESLKKREESWRPFFEGLGYKNLLWWS